MKHIYNKFRRNLNGKKLNEEYINEIKDTIRLTNEQTIAYKNLTTYDLSKELELYDNFDEIFDSYFWVMVATIREDAICEYVEKHCK